MNPYESGAAERAVRSDPELIARVQAIETVLPTLATRAQLEQLRGEMKEGFGKARAELKEEIGAVRAELKEEVGALRAEFKEEVGVLRAGMNEGFGLIRTEMKEGFGSIRAEMFKANGDLRAETQATILSAVKWSIGLAVSVAMLCATLAAAVVPLISSHLHG